MRVRNLTLFLNRLTMFIPNNVDSKNLKVLNDFEENPNWNISWVKDAPPP